MQEIDSQYKYPQTKQTELKCYTIEILELIPSLNGDILHGRFIIEKDVDVNKTIIQAFDHNNNLISYNYCFYENKEYFENGHDAAKKAIEFSIHLKGKYKDINLYMIDNDHKVDESLLRLRDNDFQKLHDKADQKQPIQSTLDVAMNLIFNEQRSTQKMLNAQRNVSFENQPLFSIIVPCYNTRITYFREMVNSVINQSYSRWELILVNASPDNAELKEKMQKYIEKYENIIMVELNENKGITLNTGEGIKRSKGEYICFLDHDDTIEADTLFHYAKAINDSKTEINLLYCDEDKLNDDGSHTEFFLKGNFSIDALIHRNYICHFMAVNNNVIKLCDYCDSRFDGAQDHFLALQCAINPETIQHIPKVLYHWRKAEGSTAKSSTNKSYANTAGLEAVNSYLIQNNISGFAVSGNKPYSYFIKYDIKEDESLTIIVDATVSVTNVSSMIKTIYLLLNYNNSKIIIISKPQNIPIFEHLDQTIENVKVITVNTIKNKYEAMNKCVESLKTKYFLLLNGNVQIEKTEAVKELHGRIQRKDVGAVGPMITYPDDTIASAGISVNIPKPSHISRGLARYAPGYMSLNNCEQNLSAISETCMMTSKEEYIQVGGFSLAYDRFYFDIDYCLKLRNINKLITYTPTVSVTYNGEFVINTIKSLEYQLDEIKDRTKIINNWNNVFLDGDPYINKNFKNSGFEPFYYLPKTLTIN